MRVGLKVPRPLGRLGAPGEPLRLNLGLIGASLAGPLIVKTLTLEHSWCPCGVRAER